MSSRTNNITENENNSSQPLSNSITNKADGAKSAEMKILHIEYYT